MAKTILAAMKSFPISGSHLTEPKGAAVSISTRIITVAFAPVLFACLSLVVVNHKLQQQNTILVAAYRSISDTAGPPIGSRMGVVHGTTPEGKLVELDLTKRASGTLLLVLSPTCPHCKANMSNWQALCRTVAPQNVLLIDISGTADNDYKRVNGLPALAPVIRLNTADRRLYNVSATPTTIWLGSHGVVQQVWTGELQNDQTQEVQKAING